MHSVQESKAREVLPSGARCNNSTVWGLFYPFATKYERAERSGPGDECPELESWKITAGRQMTCAGRPSRPLAFWKDTRTLLVTKQCLTPLAVSQCIHAILTQSTTRTLRNRKIVQQTSQSKPTPLKRILPPAATPPLHLVGRNKARSRHRFPACNGMPDPNPLAAVSREAATI